MQIIIGTDHRGFLLKEKIKTSLSHKFNFIDVGTYSEKSTDYPVISKKAVESLLSLSKQNNDEHIDNTFAVLICGTGIGVNIAVNRFSFIRGAIAFNEDFVRLSRNHNNANILCLSSDYTTAEDAIRFIEIFISEKFHGQHHIKRINQLSNLTDI